MGFTLAALVVLPVIAMAFAVGFKDETGVRYGVTSWGSPASRCSTRSRVNRRARGLRVPRPAGAPRSNQLSRPSARGSRCPTHIPASSRSPARSRPHAAARARDRASHQVEQVAYEEATEWLVLVEGGCDVLEPEPDRQLLHQLSRVEQCFRTLAVEPGPSDRPSSSRSTTLSS